MWFPFTVSVIVQSALSTTMSAMPLISFFSMLWEPMTIWPLRLLGNCAIFSRIHIVSGVTKLAVLFRSVDEEIPLVNIFWVGRWIIGSKKPKFEAFKDVSCWVINDTGELFASCSKCFVLFLIAVNLAFILPSMQMPYKCFYAGACNFWMLICLLTIGNAVISRFLSRTYLKGARRRWYGWYVKSYALHCGICLSTAWTQLSSKLTLHSLRSDVFQHVHTSDTRYVVNSLFLSEFSLKSRHSSWAAVES